MLYIVFEKPSQAIVSHSRAPLQTRNADILKWLKLATFSFIVLARERKQQQ